MDGWQTIEALKKDDVLQHIPVLVVSAHLLPSDYKKVLASGGDGYVSKPFKIADLMKEVENCLS